APTVGWGQEARRRPADAEEDPPEAGEQNVEEPEPVSTTRVACLEDASEDGYQRKGVQKRDFLKRHRFELGALGGFYASDAMSSTYTFGGALAFYPSEDFGIEALGTYMPVQFRLELPFNSFDNRIRFQPGHAIQLMGAFLFSPVHAKFKASETAIVHGDLFLIAGAGRTFHDSVQGLSWQAGAGFKLYFTSHFAFRFDARDVMLPQEILGRGRLTHNLTVLGGLSFWLL
ncbi:MAG TPA: outer membrane beta-barrel domain-containing protein, partial [Polyangia bacterium]|nr:outer membrane beta-barrel domain-containing protein [Polyangia bacterium]